MYLFHLKLHEKLIFFYLAFLCSCLLPFLGIWLACRQVPFNDAGNMFQKDKESIFFKDIAHEEGEPELLIDLLIQTG